MAADFVAHFQSDIARLQQYAREHRAGNDANRRQLDRAISVMLQRYFPEIQRSLERAGENPAVEERRLCNAAWRRRFTRYTSAITAVVLAGTLLAVVLVARLGGGTQGAKLVYQCYFAAAAVIFAATGYLLLRLKRSTKEYIIEKILAYQPGPEDGKGQ